jgi:hypothetical protein
MAGGMLLERSADSVRRNPLEAYLSRAFGNRTRKRSSGCFVCLVFRDDPHRMDYARDVPEDRQKNINPKLLSNPYLQKHA